MILSLRRPEGHFRIVSSRSIIRVEVSSFSREDSKCLTGRPLLTTPIQFPCKVVGRTNLFRKPHTLMPHICQVVVVCCKNVHRPSRTKHESNSSRPRTAGVLPSRSNSEPFRWIIVTFGIGGWSDGCCQRAFSFIARSPDRIRLFGWPWRLFFLKAASVTLHDDIETQRWRGLCLYNRNSDAST